MVNSVKIRPRIRLLPSVEIVSVIRVVSCLKIVATITPTHVLISTQQPHLNPQRQPLLVRLLLHLLQRPLRLLQQQLQPLLQLRPPLLQPLLLQHRLQQRQRLKRLLCQLNRGSSSNYSLASELSLISSLAVTRKNQTWFANLTTITTFGSMLNTTAATLSSHTLASPMMVLSKPMMISGPQPQRKDLKKSAQKSQLLLTVSSDICPVTTMKHRVSARTKDVTDRRPKVPSDEVFTTRKNATDAK